MANQQRIASILNAMHQAYGDLIAAQQGPVDPGLRQELARIATGAKRCMAELGAAHQAAATDLAAKQQHAAKLEASNKQRIDAQRQKLASPQAASCPAPAIDPKLGALLASELLARQAPVGEPLQQSVTSRGVLDDWEWSTRDLRPTIAQ